MKSEYLSIPALAERSSLSVRTLKRALTKDHSPLPSYRIGRRRVIKWAEFERWVERQQRPSATEVAAKVLAKLGN